MSADIDSIAALHRRNSRQDSCAFLVRVVRAMVAGSLIAAVPALLFIGAALFHPAVEAGLVVIALAFVCSWASVALFTTAMFAAESQ